MCFIFLISLTWLHQHPLLLFPAPLHPQRKTCISCLPGQGMLASLFYFSIYFLWKILMFFVAGLFTLIIKGLLPSCHCSDWPNSLYQDCWNVNLLWMLLPGVMSHTWTSVGFPSWCRLFQDIAFHIKRLCQALTPRQWNKYLFFIPGKQLTSESLGFCSEGKMREDLLTSSFSCSKIWNREHWEAVAAVSKQNSPPYCWNVIGVLLCPSSWRHPAGPGSRAESSLTSGCQRWNLSRGKT